MRKINRFKQIIVSLISWYLEPYWIKILDESKKKQQQQRTVGLI